MQHDVCTLCDVATIAFLFIEHSNNVVTVLFDSDIKTFTPGYNTGCKMERVETCFEVLRGIFRGIPFLYMA